MDYVFIGLIVFLFILAIFDLMVGVSNDAVNFLNSAIGARAARFKTVVAIAAVGVFLGAVLSNGMMDIARHGIFRPEQFSFFEIMCIMMAVMVTDIILLDIFNSLGMPTSTTVSMVFELLGATFAVSLFKLANNTAGLSFNDLLNTEKALSVIIGIFLSVAIAFVFGTVVQYLARLWFSFNYKKGLTWKIGLFGGISITAIIYFLLLKGAKDLTFMTPDVKAWISSNTLIILGGCFVFFTVLMQVLHWVGVNVFKVIVLTGTFALAMAFAGNDLVNFIGVPLTGFSAFQDYSANGGGDATGYLMDSLNGPASTPIYFLVAAGIVMIIALVKSKKARKVVDTSVNLSRQDAGDEMFGSSRIARRLVRWMLRLSNTVVNRTPASVRRWIGRRLDTTQAIMDEGAAFDLVRGSINLVLAGALIALGTSLKLPLSTTYVTFMVAMGSSLADRAWGRESAVFRITGVIAVIGGWFITAGAAFIGASLIVSLMHVGGVTAIVIVTVVAITILIRSNFKRKDDIKAADASLFQTIIMTEDKAQAWELLKIFMHKNQDDFLHYVDEMTEKITTGFFTDNASQLGKCVDSLAKHKAILKNERRRSTLCLKHVDPVTAIEKSTWFHLMNNCQMSMLYNLRRIAEVSHEHIDNNFRVLPQPLIDEAGPLFEQIHELIEGTIRASSEEEVLRLREQCDAIKDLISDKCRALYKSIRIEESGSMSVLYVYLNMLQELQEVVSNLRKLLRANLKLMQPVNYTDKEATPVKNETVLA